MTMPNRTYIVPPIEIEQAPERGAYARRVIAGWLPPEEAAQLRAGVMPWLPISTAPKDHTLFLAATSDGRMMIFRGDLLARALDARAPDHLTFPATHWMPLPARPATAEVEK